MASASTHNAGNPATSRFGKPIGQTEFNGVVIALRPAGMPPRSSASACRHGLDRSVRNTTPLPDLPPYGYILSGADTPIIWSTTRSTVSVAWTRHSRAAVSSTSSLSTRQFV